MSTIYMNVYGREGLKDLAKQNLAKAHYAAGEFDKKAKVLFPRAKRFNEFVVQTTADPHAMNDRLLEQKIVGGFALKKFYPELGNAALWCCTEMNTRAQIDAAVQAVQA
jgi:glycine dehydrogenase subunit 1